MLIYQKLIDRSTLRQGFQIPVEFHPILKTIPNGMPCYGDTRNIKILIDGVEYDAQLKNQFYDKNKFKHADVVQVRYGESSPIAKRLREIFSVTWNYVEQIKNLPENISRKSPIRIPEENKEFLSLHSTDIPNVFVLECVTLGDKVSVKEDIKETSELEYEQVDFVTKKDTNTGITYGKSFTKIRHLDRSIGESLKKLYDYRCQMTGERVGEQQNALCVEAHHIEPFTKSLNNDYSNIIILSPSYHRIVHKANPIFDHKQLAFIYPNGLIEKVKYDKHLNLK